nr:hypothetical protein Iba_chr04eCG18980 [Ipomoea batatas]
MWWDAIGLSFKSPFFSFEGQSFNTRFFKWDDVTLLTMTIPENRPMANVKPRSMSSSQCRSSTSVVYRRFHRRHNLWTRLRTIEEPEKTLTS